MASTKAQVRNDVLEELGVLGAGETASAEDATAVERRIDQVHAELDNLGLVAWPISAVPDNIVMGYVNIVAERSKNTFGVSPEKKNELVGAADRGIRHIRKQVSAGWSGGPTTFEEF